MADTRIIYPLDNYIGTALAEAVSDFNQARNKLHQVQDILNSIGDAPDIETAMGMAHDLYNAYNMQMILGGTITAMDTCAAGMARIDKGL